MERAIARGVRLFNTEKFFEAHEALEAVWLKAHGREKLLLHGLIQIAAAFHHSQRGNAEGLRRLLKKGMKTIQPLDESSLVIDFTDLRKQLEPWRKLVEAEGPVDLSRHPPFPKIRTLEESHPAVAR